MSDKVETIAVTLDSDGIGVNAEADVPESARSPFVLLTHGAGGDLSTPGLKAMSAGLAAAGHLTVRTDLPYRAAGRKSPPAAEKSVEGFKRIALEARHRLGRGEIWVVGGRSYGGRVASLAVAAGLDAAGVILYSYPLHRAGGAQNPRVDHWRAVNVPTLFLQGTHDPFCHLPLLERHLDLLGGPATLHRVEGAEHSLKVPASSAPDGKARSEEEVVSSVVPVVVRWLGEIAGSQAP